MFPSTQLLISQAYIRMTASADIAESFKFKADFLVRRGSKDIARIESLRNTAAIHDAQAKDARAVWTLFHNNGLTNTII